MAIDTTRYSYLFFRTLYLSAYILFFVALVGLLAVTPGDHIYQTVSNHKIGNVFVVGGSYLLTALIAVFIYASRLYTNRTTLAAIPKPYLPIEEGEVSRAVRKMIVRNRERSALVLLQTKPRKDPVNVKEPTEEGGVSRRSTDSSRGKSTKGKANSNLPRNRVLEIDPTNPPWGIIVHPGWSAPDSADLPDFQFSTVVSELPNLLEARAVSLAPPDPAFNFIAQGVQAPPDPSIVAKLQRKNAQGLRQYLGHLVGIGVLMDEGLVEEFLGMYEQARFSTQAMTEEEFRALMACFSELLVKMGEADAAVAAVAERSGSGKKESSEGTEETEESSDVGSVRKMRVVRNGEDAASVASLDSSASVIRHVAREPG
ncbi:MAG: hypothetical protein Q9159_001176 [Coniocarpon cinnabarinum]